MQHKIGFIVLCVAINIDSMESEKHTPLNRRPSIKRNILSRELLQAVKDKQKDKVRALLARKAQIDVHFFTDTQDETGFENTILLTAIKEPQKYSHEILLMLLEHNANVNLAAKNGLTPLLKAILFSNKEAALALIGAEADVLPKITLFQDQSRNALELAQEMGIQEVVSAILKKNPSLLTKRVSVRSPRELTQKR